MLLECGGPLPAVSVPVKEVHALETIPLRPLFRHPLRPKPNRPSITDELLSRLVVDKSHR